MKVCWKEGALKISLQGEQCEAGSHGITGKGQGESTMAVGGGQEEPYPRQKETPGKKQFDKLGKVKGGRTRRPTGQNLK